MLNRVKVKIYNREYSLQTEETKQYTLKLAEKLDSQIMEMMTGGSAISLVDASVLVALSSLDEAIKANDNIDNIRTQIKDYVDDAGEARLKCDEAQREIRTLKARITELEGLLK